MTAAIDITAEQRKTLLVLLRRSIPGVAVWAYGSRVKWTARPNSDLDLVAFTTPEQRPLVSELIEALAESELPFLVDLHVWDEVPERFQHIIRKEYVTLQDASRLESESVVVGEWQRYEVSQLIEDDKLVIGDGYRAKNDELAPAGLPFARAGNIKDGFQFNEADHFPEANLAKVGDKISQPGDVVFTSKGTVGRFAFVKQDTTRFVYSPQLCFWRSLDHKVIHPRFLYYWMCGREFFVQFKGVAGQTDMAEYVSLTDQRRMHVTLPSEGEQRAIAGVLGSLDDKIELNRRTSRTAEGMARAIFRAWFVDFEPVKAKAAGARSFPGMPQEAFDALTARLINSEMGPLPEGWTTKALYDTATYVNGAAFKNGDFCERRTGLPVAKIAELKYGISGQTQYSQRHLEPSQRIDTGDMLYSWSGSPDTSLDVFLWTKGPALLNQHIFKVVTTTITQKRFVYYLLRHLRPELVESARNKQTTGLGHVTVKDMKRLRVVDPPDTFVLAFDMLVGPIFDKCFSHVMESGRIAALRDYLLPKLLSGEVQVTAAEKLAEEPL
jgi:type I restriction enzyme, S subunit